MILPGEIGMDFDDLWFLIEYKDADEMHDDKVNFCCKWHEYAPKLCEWLMDNTIDVDCYDECKALFATEISQANKLYERERHKKEILSAGVAFRK